MELVELKPRKALNKAFLKVKPNRTEIEGFKTNLIQLLDRTNDTESEEFHKNLVSDFLKDTYYKQNHFINTKGRNDLVIHNGQQATSRVGVIIEAKKPTNKSEMPTQQKLNSKAFQELVLYYLRERITHKNLEVKHLVITNINEWFIFDAVLFDRLFAQHKNLLNQFTEFESGRLADTKTDFFYKQVAEPFIAELKGDIEFTYFNIQDYQKPLRNADKADDNALIALFKLLSPEHLLKLPFTNDSNSLDKRFYSELLHIIGLTETKEGGKKLIERNKEGERNSGTLLEDAIIQLDSLDKISRLEKAGQFGKTTEEKLFNVALELSITWINRILFLKLLEAQIITYHHSSRHGGKGDTSYSFLNLDKIKTYDDLNSLFFQVLARPHDQRNGDVKKIFEKVPYLNSSLFEPTELKQVTLFISNLKDDKAIPVISSTVLKDDHGKKRTGTMGTLAYLFQFLEAYDFSSEGSEEIQEDNKALINASVLGLIFEKINGYKDGSFFTPGFITMYMCHETIRKAVVQKFNETKGWQCENLEELYDKIEDRKEANTIVNSIKICDPAVGSGHFLVSALNEMIAVKNDLKILQDRSGKRLKEYHIEVVNDELIVTDEEGELFEYHPNNKESQRIQEMLFHEKQTIIENCLFGVDINPNSVKICRLRLWIELLKNAYYKNATELETLPNIDINIKCGNSLVSRFAMDADLSQALKKSKWTIDSYRIAVDTYRNADSKEQKREMEKLIADIKSDFRSEINKNDPKLASLYKLNGKLTTLTTQQSIFGMSEKEKKVWNKDVQKLTDEIKTLETEIEEIKANKIFANAFEWRFEFPEVLNDRGDYVGFDVVIGNPPYIRIQDLQSSKPEIVEFLNESYESTGSGNYDIYIPFIELGYRLLHQKSNLCYIMPNKFLNANYGNAIRSFLKEKAFVSKIIHFGSEQVFEDATTYTGIFFMTKQPNQFIEFANWLQPSEILNIQSTAFSRTNTEKLTGENWNFLSAADAAILEKLSKSSITLEDVSERIFQGLKTSADKIFILQKREELPTSYRVYSEMNEKEFELEKSFLYPLIKGGNSRAFSISEPELLILYPYYEGQLISMERLSVEAPNMLSYLLINKDYLENRESGKFKNESWYQFGRNQAIDLIKKPKIFTPDIAPSPRFSFDQKGKFMFTGGASGGYGIIPFNTISPYILLGILNSKVTAWFIRLTSTQMRGGWFSFESRYIKNIPLPTSLESKELEELVKEALTSDKDLESIKTQIDQLVYQLYDLTEEEIKIVEGTKS